VNSGCVGTQSQGWSSCKNEHQCKHGLCLILGLDSRQTRTANPRLQILTMPILVVISDSVYYTVFQKCSHFWATVCKMVCLCYQTVVCPVSLSCLSVCNVGVLWPNGWMDQDETWHGGWPRPRLHCVRWGASRLPKRGTTPSPNFWPISIVAKQLDASRCHLVQR